MKKVFRNAGIFLVIALLVFAGIKIFVAYQSSLYRETAVPFVKATVPEISRWDVATIKSFMPEDVLENTPEEKIVEIVDYLSRLGRLKEMGEPTYSSLDTYRTKSGKEMTLLTYTVDTKYENGDGVFSMSLLVNNGSFKVFSFKINSQDLVQLTNSAVDK